jgi:hypothetical protein
VVLHLNVRMFKTETAEMENFTEDRSFWLIGKLHKTFVICTLWKESLNSVSQQFYQYQQNKQSPFTSNHWT